MSKYVVRHWISGQPIDRYEFDTFEDLCKIPMVKEQMDKPNFSKLSIQVWYCMPSWAPHYSAFDLMAEFIDNDDIRICFISSIDGLDIPIQSYERSRSMSQRKI